MPFIPGVFNGAPIGGETGGGGGGGDWDTTLALGANSGANDPIIDNAQQITYTAGFTKVDPPGVLARSVTFASGGASALVNVGALIWSHDTTTSAVSDEIIVRAEGSFEITGGTNATTTASTFILSQRLTVASGSTTIAETIEMVGPEVASISFGTDTSGTLRNVFVKINEAGTAARTVNVVCRVIVTGVRSYAS
jgi:hypothetical protein